MADPSVDQLLLPFRPLLGRWEGEGRGLWDPDRPFRYREVLVLDPVPGRALISWEQVTRASSSGELSHSERGFLRVLPGAAAELVLAIPAGYVEVHRGKFDGRRLEFDLLSLGSAPTARPLDGVARMLGLEDGELVHEVGIAVGPGQPLAHVASRLRQDR